jgi:hypothetical protein
MEEVLCMRYELNELRIIKHMMIGLSIVLILEFILIMSRKLYNTKFETTGIEKYSQQKNNKVKIKEYANSEVQKIIRR